MPVFSINIKVLLHVSQQQQITGNFLCKSQSNKLRCFMFGVCEKMWGGLIINLSPVKEAGTTPTEGGGRAPGGRPPGTGGRPGKPGRPGTG